MKILKFMTSVPAGTLFLSTALAACAVPTSGTGDAQGAPGQRLIVRTAAVWSDPAAFARRASEVAGVPVRDVSEVAPRQFAFSLLCDDATICQAAVRRLTAERAFVLDLQADQRRQLPARPARSTAQ